MPSLRLAVENMCRAIEARAGLARPRLGGPHAEGPILNALLWLGLAMTALSLWLLWSTPHPIENIILTFGSVLLFLAGLLSEDVPAVRDAGMRVLTKLASLFGVSLLQAILLPAGLLLSLAAWSAAGTGALSHVRGSWIIWGVSVLVTVLALHKPSADEKQALPGRAHLAALGLVLAAALGLRLWAVGSAPAAVSGDEGSAGLVGLEFAEGLRNNLFNASWHSQISAYFGLVSLAQRALGPSLEAIRITSAIGGVLSVLGLYWAARHLFGPTHAIISAAILAFFHVHVLFSRIATSSVWDGLFFSLVLGGLWIGASRRSRDGFLLAGLAAGISHYFHPFSRLILLYALLWALLLLPRIRRDGQGAGLAAAGIVALVVLLPLIFLVAAQPQEYIAPLRAGSVTGGTPLLSAITLMPQTVLPLLAGQLRTSFLGIFLTPLRGIYTPTTPLFLPIPAALLAVGVVYALVRFRDARPYALALAFAGSLAIGAVSIEAPNAEILQALSPAASLLIAIPIVEAFRLAQSPGAVPLRAAIAATTLMVALIAALELRDMASKNPPFAEYAGPVDALSWEIGQTLRRIPDGTAVYLFGRPRLAFGWHPGLAYAAVDLEPHDLAWPLEPGMSLPDPGHHAVFLFAPEQLAIIDDLEEIYPGSPIEFHTNASGEIRFASMEVNP